MEIRPLPALLQEKAIKEINEDPDRIAVDINDLRRWFEKQPHLAAIKPCDQWLVAFLRGDNYSLEKTKKTLDMCYTLRTTVPEIFQNRDPFDPIIQEILKLGVFLPLTITKADDSCRVCLQRLGAFDPSKYRFIDLMKTIFMIVDILILEDDNFVIAGEDLLVDLKGVGIRTFSQWTPSMAKKVITIFEKALPIRMKSSHILHAPYGFKAAYTLLRFFLSEELKKRFYVYSQQFDAMYEVIPRNILPKEYGGENGSVQQLTDYWKEKVESYRDWYRREEHVRSEESLRPATLNTIQTLFGLRS
ncbi:unnamed protein product, partial [Brenthis ino]